MEKIINWEDLYPLTTGQTEAAIFNIYYIYYKNEETKNFKIWKEKKIKTNPQESQYVDPLEKYWFPAEFPSKTYRK